MIEVEKMGKPGVPIVSGRFEGDAIASSRAFGMPELQFVIVPRIYRNLPLDECVSQTELAFDQVVGTLTSNGETAEVDQRGADEENRNFEGDDRYDAVLRMNEEFIGRDWGDGFPLHPATREAVDNLLTGTCLSPDDEVCDVPPGFGIATVEKIAVNAALAGASPEHMPVIIAAVKTLSEIGGHGGKSLLMSTSPQAPLLIVNGPIAREIGLNPRSALGPGRDNRINIVVGRAFSLCLRNIGYWYPNEMDMDTIGTTRKFVHCIAENETASPWGALSRRPGLRVDRKRGQPVHNRRGTRRSGPGKHDGRGSAQESGLRLDVRDDVPAGRARCRKADPDAAGRSRSNRSVRACRSRRRALSYTRTPTEVWAR